MVGHSGQARGALGRDGNRPLLEPADEKSIHQASEAHDVKAKILLPLSEQVFSIDRIGEYAMIVSAMV
jgi:hypothetical protein